MIYSRARNVKPWKLGPNPPIAEEFWGIWMSQQRIDAEEAP